jgi:hypothetical protein
MPPSAPALLVDAWGVIRIKILPVLVSPPVLHRRAFPERRDDRYAQVQKMYCVDHALVASVSSGILVNSGHLLENLVFLQLLEVA